MTMQLSPSDWEALSAYLDGQLPARERARLEKRLRANTQLRTALEELRRTRRVLRSTPRLRAPRNFTLTPQMAGLRRARPRAYPAFRLAFALASILFVLVFVGDLATSGLQTLAPPATRAVQLEQPLQKLAGTPEAALSPAAEEAGEGALAPSESEDEGRAVVVTTLAEAAEPTPVEKTLEGETRKEAPPTQPLLAIAATAEEKPGEPTEKVAVSPPDQGTPEGTSLPQPEALPQTPPPVPSPTPIPTQTSPALALAPRQPAAPAPPRNPLRTLEFVLAGIALLSGFALLAMRRNGG